MYFVLIKKRKNNSLSGKTCFITGATGGLGKSLASGLALSQCNLFLTSTNKKKLEELKKNLLKLIILYVI